MPHLCRMALALLPLLAGAQDQPPARFHHVHLNSTDPAAAIDFYTSRLEAGKRSFAGLMDGVFANNVWLLFTKVATPPKWEITSGIWHIGWGGGADMKDTYQKQLDRGTKFFTPLTDLSDQCDGKGGNGRFLFAYIDGPDHALTELNTTAAGNFRFGHVHLLSEDPIAAAEWYMKHFGLKRRGSGPISREIRHRCGRQTAPAVSMMIDDVNLIIYPVGNAKAAFPDVWKGRTAIESSQGHALDHLGFAVENLDQTLDRLRAAGVKVLAEPRSIAGGKLKYAFLEGPDLVRIEVLEDNTARP
ncbi:MAG: VOC family protein [Bryobacteraceae bacterium]|nr:VOC family protein [Bryobacteraceae bacterium]